MPGARSMTAPLMKRANLRAEAAIRRPTWRRRALQPDLVENMRYPFLLLLAVGLMSDLNADTNTELWPLPTDAWRLVTDGVMGGVSRGELSNEAQGDTACLALRGRVSTANNGGFIQMALDLDEQSAARAGQYDGLLLDVRGNGEEYNVHLRTSYLWLPWQSYRASFMAGPEWQSTRLPFAAFAPYKTTTALKLDKLRRIGIVAIGRDFDADLCVRQVAFYRNRR